MNALSETMNRLLLSTTSLRSIKVKGFNFAGGVVPTSWTAVIHLRSPS